MLRVSTLSFRSRPLGLGSLALTIACRGLAPTPCEPRVTLGTGTSAFRPLSDADELPMVFGPQGGYHLPLAFEACDMGSDAITSVMGTRLPDGLPLVNVNLRSLWGNAESSCCASVLDVRGFLFAVDDTNFDYRTLAGARLALTLELTAPSGEVWSDAAEITLLDVVTE